MRYLIIGLLFLLACTENTMAFDDDSELFQGRPNDAGAPGGWSAAGTLAQGNTIKRVRLQANFDKPGPYTVQFGLTPPAGSPANPTRAEAKITWAVEGNFISRRVTVGNGLSISGTGQGVLVELYDQTVDVGGGAITNDEYQVSALVTPGTRPSKNQPPVLLSLNENNTGVPGIITILAGTTEEIDVPEDAGIISVNQNLDKLSNPTGYFRVMHCYDAEELKTYELEDAKGIWIPVSPGTNNIKIQNNTATPISVSTVFGIDG